MSGLTCQTNQVPKWNGTTWVCGGTLGTEFSAVFPDTIDNTVWLDIERTFQGNVIVTGGPGFQIQRVPGFPPDGSDGPGPNVEFPFVFEYAGSQAANLELLHNLFLLNGVTQPIAVIIRDLSGTERFRWTLSRFGLTQIGAGGEGRNRYTFVSQDPPDNQVGIQLVGSFPSDTSNNPATDTKTEIEGVAAGFYPVVQVDTTNRTVTLTFDYNEAGEAFSWIRNTAMGLDNLRNISVIQETNGVETSRTNYFEAFPIVFRHFTGFGQTEKVKIRIVIAYGHAELG